MIYVCVDENGNVYFPFGKWGGINMPDETKYVVVYGGMADGFQGVVGPFNSYDEAETYMESHNLGHFEKFVQPLEEAWTHVKQEK